MRMIEISEIADLLEKYDKTEQPLILTRNGQPVAALFPRAVICLIQISSG